VGLESSRNEDFHQFQTLYNFWWGDEADEILEADGEMRNAYKILFEKQAKGVFGINRNGLTF
jgi:hypothetical protein